MFKFLNIEYFILLIPLFILVLFLYFKWWYKIKFWPINDLKEIYPRKTFIYKFYYFLLFIIFIFYVIILANPVIQNVNEKIKKNWIDIEIVLDVSYSMIAEDLKPNRLEVAKNVINQFLSWLKNDRVGIIVFSWKPFKSLPLNFDYNITKKIVNNITIDTINQYIQTMQWTAIWDWLVYASESFLDTKDIKRGKVIILLTDWEANKWLHPEMALKYLIEKNIKNPIKVYTIWIWWTEKVLINIRNPIWGFNRIEVWWVDEVILKKIALDTGWKYFRATDKAWLEEIFSTISKLEKRELEIETIIDKKEANEIFLYLLIYFMFTFILLKIKKKI